VLASDSLEVFTLKASLLCDRKADEPLHLVLPDDCGFQEKQHAGFVHFTEHIMAKQPHQQRWQHLSIYLLLGIVSGGIANVIAVLAFTGLYAVSFALANQLDGWLAFGVFAVFMILSTIISGIIGGLVGGVVSGFMAQRWWRPSRRWLIVWAMTWLLGGLVLWIVSIQGMQAGPALSLISSGWWALLGVIIALAFAMIAPPWRSLAAPAP
jgi:Mn2+/Fe2+ NRAMP family transporter